MSNTNGLNNNQGTKYKTFSEFISKGNGYLSNLKPFLKDMEENQQVMYARNNLPIEVLNSFVVVCNLPQNIMDMLKATDNKLRFSVDNLIKNKLNHPEVTDEDYFQIPNIVKFPTKYYFSVKGFDVILFKADPKYYKLVIKTTHNRKENYIKSLHLINKERFNKY